MLAHNHDEILANADIIYQPQPGPQMQFFKSRADVVIYGGAAGGGKTYALLLEAIRHHQNPLMRSVIFREQMTQITDAGGLWDESEKIFPHFGAKPNNALRRWHFPSGSEVHFKQLSHDKTVRAKQGMQASFFGFDELTHFKEKDFWYMFTRSRSDSGINSYIRCTCNPPDGVNPEEAWVARLIRWWLDDNGKYPDPAKAGAIRWFARASDKMFWGFTRQELMDNYGFNKDDCSSITFIPAKVEDNQILLKNQPKYLSMLAAANENDKKRLLYGDWSVSSAGSIFETKYFRQFIIEPHNIDYRLITVDTAQKTKQNNDYTVMQLWGLKDKGIYLLDQVRGKFEYPQLKMMAQAFFLLHSNYDLIAIEDAVSGTALIQDLLGDNRFHNVIGITRTKDKLTRALDALPYVTGGYIYINQDKDYYVPFTEEVASFRGDLKHLHDDQVDCMLDAVDKLLINPPPAIKFRHAQKLPSLARRSA